MKKNALLEAIKDFFKTTTLHGFKYLYSGYYIDRIGWFICCCASAACGAMLCIVLWARFMKTPALLALSPDTNMDEYRIPSVALCPSVQGIAASFVNKLSPNQTNQGIPTTLMRLLGDKSTTVAENELLNNFLVSNKVELVDLMMEHTPNCSTILKKCRYKYHMIPCEDLFTMELMIWGPCCVMKPERLNYFKSTIGSHFELFEVEMQCVIDSKAYFCEFYTIHPGEKYVLPDQLYPGNFYTAHLSFSVTPKNSDRQTAVDYSCVNDKDYTHSFCLLECAEHLCSCRDPFHVTNNIDRNKVISCSVMGIACVRNNDYANNVKCNCLSQCTDIVTVMNLETNAINCAHDAIDPFYANLDPKLSAVLKLLVQLRESKVYYLNPTETWLTLLSSLGGVFNMFLGVGLFSALELLFLIFFRLPVAIKKVVSSTHTPAITH